MSRKLSEVEFSEICNNEGWLTSATGKKGKVVDVVVKPYGNGWGVMLHLIWEDESTSFPYWPHHCDKVIINE